MKTRVSTILIAFVAVLAACTTTEPGTPPTTAVSTTAVVEGAETSVDPTAPDPVLSDLAGEELLVSLEARWMCDVQRFAFPDLSAMNNALDEHLADHGVTRSDYDAFKAEMEEHIELREQVLDGYDAYCGED